MGPWTTYPEIGRGASERPIAAGERITRAWVAPLGGAVPDAARRLREPSQPQLRRRARTRRRPKKGPSTMSDSPLPAPPEVAAQENDSLPLLEPWPDGSSMSPKPPSDVWSGGHTGSGCTGHEGAFT